MAQTGVRTGFPHPRATSVLRSASTTRERKSSMEATNHPRSSEADAAAAGAVPVTADNFIRAETDMYFGMLVKRAGGLGHFDHLRELHSIEGPSVRPNRDTLYSEAVFDLDAGPVE